MKRYSIGLDIGIASCGWSIVDIDKKEIVDLGSRIFPSGNAAGNQDRRNFRGLRRLTRRRENRLSDFMKLLAENNFPVKFDKDKNRYVLVTEFNNVYELRVNGLAKQLSKEELAASLYHIVNRRGISYKLSDVSDTDGKDTDYGKRVKQNIPELQKGKTVGQIQLERLEKFGQVRGQVKVDDSDEKTLLNVFPASAYADEARQILLTQKEFYPELTDEFIEKIIDLVTRKREYFHGPGSEKSPTPYGRFRIKNGKVEKIGENLYEALIGTDKINGKKRAPASSYTAQMYNLLNDLNNLTILEPNDKTDENGKLTKQSKEEIIALIKSKDKVGVSDIIKYIFETTLKNENLDDYITGFRIKQTKEKSEKIIHTLKGYRNIRDVLKENLDIEMKDLPDSYFEVNDFFDKIAYFITLNSETAEVRKQLEKNTEFNDYQDFLKSGKVVLDEETGEEKFVSVLDIFAKKSKKLLVDGNAKWHSFSYTTLAEMNEELLNTPLNQMQILHELGKSELSTYNFKNKHKVPVNEVIKDIYNPVVAASVKESLKIFNKIISKYKIKDKNGNIIDSITPDKISNIVIELPRDEDIESFYTTQKGERITLTAEKAKVVRVKKYNDIQAKINSEKQTVKEEFGIEHYHNVTLKERLWYEQKGICPYCGKNIPKNEQSRRFAGYEIDHIIPISISADDSKSNKVLVHSICNQEKKARTPFGWGMFWSWQNFENYIKTNERFSRSKKNNLLSKVDLNSIDTRKRFVARNLNDTRYASKVVLNIFDEWIRQNNLETKRPKVVRGGWTHQMRTKWNAFDENAGEYILNKTRDTHHHHAIDASIIASFPLVHAFSDYVTVVDNADEETGEIGVSTAEWKNFVISNDEFKAKIGELKKSMKRFSEQLYLANDIGHFEVDKGGKKKFIEDSEKIKNNLIKISHRVDKKTNRKIADATIYSSKKFSKDGTIKFLDASSQEIITKSEEGFYTISKIDIYAEDSKKTAPNTVGFKEFKQIVEDEQQSGILPRYSRILMKRNDEKTFKKLLEIMNNPDFIAYDKDGKKTNTSPFQKFKEEYGYITKYTKKDNGLLGKGPKVITLKYLSGSKALDKSIKLDVSKKQNSEEKFVYLEGLNHWRTDLYINENGKYEFLYLRYSDIKVDKNGERIAKNIYEERKKAGKINDNSQFIMSLYKNDIVELAFSKDTTNKRLNFRFSSGRLDGRFELKPVHKDSFEKGEIVGVNKATPQFLVSPSQMENIVKINTDILGNPYYTEKESDQPKLKIKN